MMAPLTDTTKRIDLINSCLCLDIKRDKGCSGYAAKYLDVAP